MKKKKKNFFVGVVNNIEYIDYIVVVPTALRYREEKKTLVRKPSDAY